MIVHECDVTPISGKLYTFKTPAKPKLLKNTNDGADDQP